MTELKFITISDIVEELHKVFDLFNKAYFNEMLPPTAITIQSNGNRKLSMGWCTTKPVWGNEDGSIQMYEINLSAEFMNQDFFETMDTMLHEMVHLFHMVTGVQDTSREGIYHNKRFRDKVLELGFEYNESKPHPQYGWTFARLGAKAKEKIGGMPINREVFVLARYGYAYFKAITEGRKPQSIKGSSEASSDQNGGSIEGSKPSAQKWVCPNCNVIVRSHKKELNIICGDCNQQYVKD
ncbi:SprT-like domain-containing protein [Paenibacillus lautus]|uniref:SprT-like domain-containing protein n=1 Tax=Paenibacillus lautus TaxID=1401 RepID=UPI003D2CB96E